jgi:glycosyltransferase involved in cell wall biosynthesis
MLPRVIYAWNYLEWGGAQVHILAIIKEARKHFDILVVLPEKSDPKIIRYLEDLGVDHDLFPGSNDMGPAPTLSRKISRRFRKARSEWSMLRCLARHDLKRAIVHVDLLPHSSLAALMWLARRTHVFITSHNALPPVSRFREGLWKMRARVMSRSPNFHVFCSNEHAKTYFSQHYSPELAEKIEVTYTSMNPEEIDHALDAEFDREGWRAKLGIPTNAFIVLTVGNFIDRKGRWTLLDAAARLQNESSIGDIYFVWLSPFLPEGDDKKRFEEHLLEKRFQVILSDSVGTERIDVLKFFRIADAFALPSFVEGLPIALLEAMAIGLPSISTNVYAIPEALKHEKTGLLVEAGDSAALADSILRYRNDPEFRDQMAQDGREYVREHFDEREVARRVVSAYKRAL